MRWLLVCSVFLLICFISCTEHSEPKEPSDGIFTSAETVKTVNNQKKFSKGPHLFGNGQTRSSEEARTGSYCSKVSEISPYSFDYTLNDAQPGDKVIATVWRKGGKGVLAVKNSSGYYKQAEEPVNVENGWEQLQLEWLIDDYNYKEKFLVHCWLPEKGSICYFDDFRVEVKRLNRVKATIPAKANALHISLSEEAKKQLQIKRDEAIDIGLIVKSKDSWVAAKVKSEEGESDARIRLKGDMLDHVRGKKWSFRVELKEGERWKNMTEFSLQNPVTRGYLHEWYFHELLQREKILTPSYGFVFVVLNGDTLGLYAYEEHFTPQLLASQNKPIAPILKFDEDMMWQVRKQNNMQDVDGLPLYEVSEIKAYGGTRNEYSSLAKGYVDNYRFGTTDAAEIISPEKTATYFAALDLTKAYHALIWHNQRWYYNPTEEMLEPIGYDGYTHNGPFNWVDAPYLGYRFIQNQTLHKDEITRLLFDSTIYKKYNIALEKMATEEYVQGFLKATKKEAEKYTQWIKVEYPEYKYNKNYILNNVKEIQEARQNDLFFEAPEVKPKVAMLFDGEPSYPQVFFHAVEDSSQLKFYNFYPAVTRVVGLGNSPTAPEREVSINLPAYRTRHKPEQKTMPIKKGSYSYAFFQLEESGKIFSVSIKQ